MKIHLLLSALPIVLSINAWSDPAAVDISGFLNDENCYSTVDSFAACVHSLEMGSLSSGKSLMPSSALASLPAPLQNSAVSFGFFSIVSDTGTDWEQDRDQRLLLELSNPGARKSEDYIKANQELAFLYRNDVIMRGNTQIEFTKAAHYLQEINLQPSPSSESRWAGISTLMAHAYMNSFSLPVNQDVAKPVATAPTTSTPAALAIVDEKPSRIRLIVHAEAALVDNLPCGSTLTHNGDGCWWEPQAGQSPDRANVLQSRSNAMEYGIQIGQFDVSYINRTTALTQGRCVDDPHFSTAGIKPGAYYCDYSNSENIREILVRWVPEWSKDGWIVQLPVGVVHYSTVTNFNHDVWENYNPDARSYNAPCMIGGDSGSFNPRSCSAAEVNNGYSWSLGLRVVHYLGDLSPSLKRMGAFVELNCNGSLLKKRDSISLGLASGIGQCLGKVGMMYQLL